MLPCWLKAQGSGNRCLAKGRKTHHPSDWHHPLLDSDVDLRTEPKNPILLCTPGGSFVCVCCCCFPSDYEVIVKGGTNRIHWYKVRSCEAQYSFNLIAQISRSKTERGTERCGETVDKNELRQRITVDSLIPEAVNGGTPSYLDQPYPAPIATSIQHLTHVATNTNYRCTTANPRSILANGPDADDKWSDTEQ